IMYERSPQPVSCHEVLSFTGHSLNCPFAKGQERNLIDQANVGAKRNVKRGWPDPAQLSITFRIPDLWPRAKVRSSSEGRLGWGTTNRYGGDDREYAADRAYGPGYIPTINVLCGTVTGASLRPIVLR
ncbi:MAG TPA: hypothetical protein VF342_12990, partial [Alphaproteobacteria bacterium]